MIIKLLITFWMLVLSGDVFAYDCKEAGGWLNGGDTFTYCRVANALEKIAENMSQNQC